MGHQSDSSEQQAVEPLILEYAAQELNAELRTESLPLPGGARVEVDGVCPERSAFVEVYARQGRLKGAQLHKVARDALKLITLGREYPQARLAIAFGDESAADCIRGSSWLSEALVTWGVRVLVAPLDDESRAQLIAAQDRQVMVNPPPDEPD